MTPVEVTRGTGPIVLGFPHAGTHVPEEIKARLNERGRILADTDWHIDRLYSDLLPDVTVVRATFHRYVIDANRDPSGVSLYPGQNTTALVPLTDFDGHDIWDAPPTAADVKARRASCHVPYHKALQGELKRVRKMHGVAILYDCHSIRSRIPFLFEGALPDFNIGTNLGTSCAPALQDAVSQICRDTPGYSTIVNGRFKGGWATRHYGRPDAGRHAIQMELAQSTYLTDEAPPWTYNTGKADQLRSCLKTVLTTLADKALSLGADQ